MSNVNCALRLSKKSNQRSNYEPNTAILEMINEGLSSFGNLAKEAIYRNLERQFKIKEEEIPCKIEEFTDAIEQMLGNGAKIVEIEIIKKIHKRMPKFVFFPKEPDLNFKDYLLSFNSYLLSIA